MISIEAFPSDRAATTWKLSGQLKAVLKIRQLIWNKRVEVDDIVFHAKDLKIYFETGPGQAPGLFSQYPVRREWFRPKTWKCILVVSNALILRIIHEFYIKNIWLIQPTNNIWKLTRIIRSRTRSLLEQQAQGPKCAGQGKTAFASRLWMNTQTHSLHLVDESCFPLPSHNLQLARQLSSSFSI